MPPSRPDWPSGFSRIPDEPWVREPVADLATSYDELDGHGWYANLDSSVATLREQLTPGRLLVDYSAGTGILGRRLLAAQPAARSRLLNVDSSPKFLRLAVERLGADPRVAFRLIRWREEEKRLDYLHEVLGPLVGTVNAIASTNAVHLYYDLPGTLASWARCLAPGGFVHVQSGNLARDGRPAGVWTIDDTVEAIAERAERLVAEEPLWKAHRPLLADADRMEAYRTLRRKFFLPVRPVSFYVDALGAAGLPVERVAHRLIEVRVDEWLRFLEVYHEGILGWVGGSKKVDGREPEAKAVKDRVELLREAGHAVFEGKGTFRAEWTYLDAAKA